MRTAAFTGFDIGGRGSVVHREEVLLRQTLVGSLQTAVPNPSSGEHGPQYPRSFKPHHPLSLVGPHEVK